MARPGALFGLLAAFWLTAAAAQETAAPPLGVVVVDQDRILRESEVARRLAARDQEARRILQDESNALRAALEAEEAEIAALRGNASREVFDARVRAFNDKAQEARRSVQRRMEDIQRRFGQTRQRMAEALPPVLAEIMEEEGAAMVIDSRFVLVAREGADRTTKALERFNAATKGMFPELATPEE